MDRYNRHIILSEIGPSGQEKISRAKVLVIGAGGLGCPVLQYLAAAGVGILGIMDHDVVSESNLQRQILYGSSSLGKNKSLAAKQRLKDLNETITIHAYPEKLTHKNALELFSNYDIIVDGTDNFAARYLINDASIISEKPLVFGSIYKFEGQVTTFNYNNGPSYRCLFPTAPKEGSAPNCSEVGVLGVLPGIIGTFQANEVLKIILGLGDVLSGKILFFNALTVQSTILFLNRSEEEINKVLSGKGQFRDIAEESFCAISSTENNSEEISIEEAFNMKNVQFIDVREYHEQPKVDFLNPVYIPLSEIDKNIDKIDGYKIKALFCQAGIRSKKAVAILQQHHIDNCYSIKDGASEIIRRMSQKEKP